MPFANQKSRKVDAEQPYAVSSEKTTDADVTKQTIYGKLFQSALEIIDEYCTTSSLHGVRYFVEKKRHWLERVWWIVGFLVSLCCCGALIYNIFDNWDRRSVIVSFAEEQTPVWDIPFPAVTICPSTKIELEHLSLSGIYDKIRYMNFTEEEFKVMSAFNHICGAFPSFTKSLENFTDGTLTEDVIRIMAPKLNDTVGACSFTTEYQNCELEEIMTEEGLCFTFNMFNRKETYYNDSIHSHLGHNKTAHWNLENGYDPKIKKHLQTYPYRVFGSGPEGQALYFLLGLSKTYFENKCYFNKKPGYKLILHTPGEIPQVHKYYLDISTLETVSVSLKPNIITTSEGLRRIPPNRRKCYFDSERKLSFLKVYTERNCELECLSNFTLSLCGCVTLSMPREVNTPICGPAKIECCNWARTNSLEGLIKKGKHIRQGEDIKLKELVKNCNCFPACNSITYDAEILKNPSASVTYYQFENYVHSELILSFKENRFITLTRSELYGLTDFVANCGGLLGLFVGASFLSIVELLYYCSLRLCCNIQKRINRKRKNEIQISAVSGIRIVKETEEIVKNG